MSGYMNTSKTVEWETPQELFDQINHIYNFTIDVCANEQNHKCDRFYTKEQDGLAQSWKGEKVWCNPPYGREIADWVRKAYECADKNTIIVMLVPARTDTKWFHKYAKNKAQVILMNGRLKFGGMDKTAPFPSMLLIYGGGK